MKRREFRVFHRIVIVTFLVFFAISTGQRSTSQEQETPVGPRWWPSAWGPDDQKGALNHITPTKVVESEKSHQGGKGLRIRPRLRAGYAAKRRSILQA